MNTLLIRTYSDSSLLSVMYNKHYNNQQVDVISYSLFADADTRIYPHAASQYPAQQRPSVVLWC